MLKTAAIISLALITTACTLHPPTEKQAICTQAQRQVAYNNTLNVGVPSASKDAELQKTIAMNC